jgi:hypothetical protein
MDRLRRSRGGGKTPCRSNRREQIHTRRELLLDQRARQARGGVSIGKRREHDERCKVILALYHAARRV